MRLALYGLMDLPTSVIGLPIALYIPAFYSQNLRLSLAAVGAPLMLLSLWMLFVPTSAVAVGLWGMLGGDAVSNLYLFVWISLLYLSITLVDLPYRAWGAELTPDYDERSRVTGWREAFGYGGTLMALFIPLILAAAYGMAGPANALLGIAVAVLVLIPLLFLPGLIWVRERPARGTPAARVPWKRGLRIVWSNGPYRRLVISLVFLVVAVSMTASLSFFFVASVMQESFERYALFILACLLPVEQRRDSDLVRHFRAARQTQDRRARRGMAFALERLHSPPRARPLLALLPDHDPEGFRGRRAGVPAGLDGRARQERRRAHIERRAQRMAGRAIS